MTCDHPTFAATIGVGRVIDDETGRVIGFVSEIKIQCDACGEPFTFQGLPAGLSQHHPTVSVDGQMLRAPIAPSSAKLAPLDKLGDHDHNARLTEA